MVDKKENHRRGSKRREEGPRGGINTRKHKRIKRGNEKGKEKGDEMNIDKRNDYKKEK